MKRKSTIKKHLETAGFTVIERDGTLVLAQELQEETRTYKHPDGSFEYDYAPFVHDLEYDCCIAEEVQKIAGVDYFWECEYPSCFKLYEA